MRRLSLRRYFENSRMRSANSQNNGVSQKYAAPSGLSCFHGPVLGFHAVIKIFKNSILIKYIHNVTSNSLVNLLNI